MNAAVGRTITAVWETSGCHGAGRLLERH